MIFVTVGTHEQQFDRLIEKIDELKHNNVIRDEVFIQLGYSTYIPQFCQWKKLLSYDEMDEMYKRADIIITHGGPASFMKALELGKIPIVVPRQIKYAEHINDHQVEFVKFVEQRQGNIIGVYDIDDLTNIIKLQYENSEVICIKSNNDLFNENVSTIIKHLWR